MLRRITTFILLISCLLFVSTGNLEAKKQTFEELCLEILETIQSFYPVRSTEMGIHSYDYRLTDYSSTSINSFVKKLKNYEKKLYNYKKSNLTEYQSINRRLIKSNVDMALHDIKQISWYKKSPHLYAEELVNGIYFLLLSNDAPLVERSVSIISRMKSVTRYLAVAKKNIKKPPQVYIDAATESLESGIDFYQEVAAELMREFPEKADNILKQSTQAREAMTDFINWLSEIEVGPETAFAIGKDNFDYKLEHEYFLDFDSDSMLVLGELLLEEIDKVYKEYEQYVEENHQNGQDSVYIPSCFSRSDILDYYNWETEQVKIFLKENNIVTIPEDIAPVSVIETPPFLRSMISGIAYQPAAAFDTIQHGYFYIRPLPKELDQRQLDGRYRYVHRRGFKGSVVHEAYPGHHLQMQLAGMNSDPVRKCQFNLMMIEGWALYCEEMIYHEGLYGEEDPARWLGTLGGIRFRAARIVVDVRLHTGQLSYSSAVNWMINTLDVDTDSGREYIAKEVRRYTHSPTYQMSYLMGKREIMRLRNALMEKEGDNFSLKEFHDAILAEGSIPPALLWDILGVEK